MFYDMIVVSKDFVFYKVNIFLFLCLNVIYFFLMVFYLNYYNLIISEDNDKKIGDIVDRWF